MSEPSVEDRIREAQAVAWDQGYLARSGDTYDLPSTPNPYRTNDARVSVADGMIQR